MSYTIIYDKQFVKVNDKFIPILYWGCSNLFESTYNNRTGKRVRDWENYKYGLTSLAHTKDELLAMCETYRKELIDRNDENLTNNPDRDKYEDKHFGYFAGLAIGTANTSKATYGMFKGLFKTGIEKALTVEELKKFGVSVTIKTSIYDKEKLDALNLAEINLHIECTNQLVDAIERLKAYPFGTYYITMYASERTMKNIRRTTKQNKPKRERKTKTVTTGYSFMCDAMHFVKNTKYGFKYTLYPTSNSIKVVYNEKEALRKLAALNALHVQQFTLRTIKLENPKEIFV